ncbi:MAG: hypothetical protein ACYS76_03415 [Planctomycetota bacterium]|jgi:hypothetical protein
MYNIKLTPSVRVFVAVTASILAQDAGCAAAPVVPATNKEKQTVSESLPGQVGLLFKWPDLTAIPSDKIVNGAENRHTAYARSTSVRWVKRIIADEWLPADANDLDRRLVMVRDEHGPIDVTHVEWQKKGYRFRSTQSRTVFTLTITPTTEANAVGGETLPEKVASAAGLCASIIRNLPEVEIPQGRDMVNIAPQGTMPVLLAKSFSEGSAKQCNDGIAGPPAKIDWQNHHDVRTHNHWWRRMGWWTDGRTLGLYTLKIGGGAWKVVYGAALDNTWFEGPPADEKAKTGRLSD